MKSIQPTQQEHWSSPRVTCLALPDSALPSCSDSSVRNYVTSGESLNESYGQAAGQLGALPTGEPSTQKRLLKKPDLAKLCSLSPRMIESLICQGLPHLRISYRCLRFDPEAVIAWLHKRYGLSSQKSHLCPPRRRRRRRSPKPLQPRATVGNNETPFSCEIVRE
jgi:hypothetical protein